MAHERERLSLQDATFVAIEEARMVLPGIQALFGFQLIAVFNARFERLDPTVQHLHMIALILVALAIAFVMAPAAYHRIAERGWVSRQLVRRASTLITAGMVALMLALALEVGLVSGIVFEIRSTTASVVAAAALFAVLLFLWFLLPLHARRKRRACDTDDR